MYLPCINTQYGWGCWTIVCWNDMNIAILSLIWSQRWNAPKDSSPLIDVFVVLLKIIRLFNYFTNATFTFKKTNMSTAEPKASKKQFTNQFVMSWWLHVPFIYSLCVEWLFVQYCVSTKRTEQYIFQKGRAKKKMIFLACSTRIHICLCHACLKENLLLTAICRLVMSSWAIWVQNRIFVCLF